MSGGLCACPYGGRACFNGGDGPGGYCGDCASGAHTHARAPVDAELADEDFLRRARGLRPLRRPWWDEGADDAL